MHITKMTIYIDLEGNTRLNIDIVINVPSDKQFGDTIGYLNDRLDEIEKRQDVKILSPEMKTYYTIRNIDNNHSEPYHLIDGYRKRDE